jgi:hypothetical protein
MDFLRFLWRVLRHWGALVTGGAFIGGLTIYQGVGHPVPHWAYWTIAGVALFGGSFLAWRDEYRRTKEFEAKLLKIEASSGTPAVHNIYLPPPPPKAEPPKHNVQCLGVKIEDYAVVIEFQNVPRYGSPLGDFHNARLCVEYRREATGELWDTVFPVRWIADGDTDVSIGITPVSAFLAAYHPTSDRKWKALVSYGISPRDPHWKDRIGGVPLPHERLQVKATLVGENNLTLQPIKGILALGGEGEATWTPIDE